MKVKIKLKKNPEIITEIVNITTPFIKLDQLLKFSGIAESGGHAKEIVAEGVVLVNNEVCLVRGKKIKDSDKVQVDNIILTVKSES